MTTTVEYMRQNGTYTRSWEALLLKSPISTSKTWIPPFRMCIVLQLMQIEHGVLLFRIDRVPALGAFDLYHLHQISPQLLPPTRPCESCEATPLRSPSLNPRSENSPSVISEPCRKNR